MKTIIKKGELLSELNKVDEDLFKDSLEEIFWEDIDSAFPFSRSNLEVDWQNNLPMRLTVELEDEEYSITYCITIITFFLNKKDFISYIYGSESFCEDYYNEKYITHPIDSHILKNILISYTGSLRRYSDEMSYGEYNENNFFE